MSSPSRAGAQATLPQASPLPPVPGPEQAARELVTLRDLIRWSCSRMAAAGVALGQGTESLRDEATWLALWALRLALDDPEPHLDARLLTAEREAIAALVERRCVERLPTAYLTGEAWLRGLRFRADPRALVPRSVLVEALDGALDPWLPDDPPATVLDLCTGGGSIAVAAALRFAQASVSATDLSADALALAAENLALHGLEDRVTLYQGDLYGGLPAARHALILSNPPYVNAASMAALPAEYRHEPQQALAGGPDGMHLIARILREAPERLARQGLLVIEIGHEAHHFEAAFPGLEFAYVPVSAGEEMIVATSREALTAWKRAT